MGIDYYDSNYDSKRGQTEDTINTPIHALDVEQKSSALYIQNISRFSNDTTVNIGVRTQQVKLSARDRFDASAPGGAFGSQAADLDTRDRESSYELGLRQQVSEFTALFGKFARSVRFATIDEIFELDPATFVQLFSPLDPQTANSIELGVDYTRSHYTATASIYRMNLDNEIHFDPISFTNENLDPTRRSGFEASMKAQINEILEIKANLAHTRAEFREGTYSGNDVPLVPRNTASLSTFWDITAQMQFVASVNHVGEKYFDNDQNNGFSKIPSYQTVDLKLTATRGPWQINGMVNNAFDKKAFDYGAISTFTAGRYNAYPLPERNCLLSVMRDF
jgi:iron complex outermembrane receptor protein